MGFTVDFADGRSVDFKNKPTKADIDEADVQTQKDGNFGEFAKEQVRGGIRRAGRGLPLMGAIGGEFAGSAAGSAVGSPPSGRILGAALGGAGGSLASQEIQETPIPTGSRLASPAIQGLTGLPTQLITPQQEPPTREMINEASGQGLGYGIFSGIGELVGGGVKGLVRSRAKEMADRIVPKAFKAINKSFVDFKAPIQDWFKTKFDVPDSVLNTLRNKGVEAVRAAKNKIGDSVDDIYTSLRDGVLKKEAEASAAEKAVYDQVGEGRVIDISDYIDKGLSKLKSIGRVTKAGHVSETGQQVARQGNVLDDLFDRLMRLNERRQIGYDIGKPGLVKDQTIDISRKGLGAKFQQKTTRLNVSKLEYQILKDEIQRWFRSASGAEKQVLKKVKNAFVDSGERAGLIGLREADKLYSSAIQKTGQFLQKGELKNISKGVLENWHKAGTKARNLVTDLSDYIGSGTILDDLDNFSAGKYIDKVNKFVTEDASANIFSILKGATEGVQRGQVKKQLTQLIGKKMANEIVKEVASFGLWRRAGKVVGGAALYGAARKANLLPFGGGGDGNQ